MRLLKILMAALLSAGALRAQPLLTNPSCPDGGSGMSSCFEGSPVLTFNCWQRTLHRNTYTASAYEDIRLKVTFQRSGGGESFSTYAYWDTPLPPSPQTPDHDEFRIRAMFPLSGDWSFTLTCEAGDCGPGSGLSNDDNPSRTLEVQAYESQSGANDLFQKGSLSQSSIPSGWAPIRHRNGEVFHWIGDSAWAAPLRSLPAEWVSYVNDRRAKGFTVIHIGIAPDWAGGCREADIGEEPIPPFNDQTECAPAVWFNSLVMDEPVPWRPPASAIVPGDGSTPRHEFFERLASFVQTANCQGLAVLVAGLMEPVNRYPTKTNAELFARNLAGRLNGNHVVFSPGFDDRIDAECSAGIPPSPDDPPSEGGYSESDQLLRQIGDVISGAAPTHLILNHPGTNGKKNSPAQDLPTTA